MGGMGGGHLLFPSVQGMPYVYTYKGMPYVYTYIKALYALYVSYVLAFLHICIYIHLKAYKAEEEMGGRLLYM